MIKRGYERDSGYMGRCEIVNANNLNNLTSFLGLLPGLRSVEIYTGQRGSVLDGTGEKDMPNRKSLKSLLQKALEARLQNAGNTDRSPPANTWSEEVVLVIYQDRKTMDSRTGRAFISRKPLLDTEL
jgi:hypothetical protein